MPRVGRSSSQEVALRNQGDLQQSATPPPRGRGRNNNTASARGLDGLSPRPSSPPRSGAIDTALSRMTQSDSDQAEIQSTAAKMTANGMARAMQLKADAMIAEAGKDAMKAMGEAGKKID